MKIIKWTIIAYFLLLYPFVHANESSSQNVKIPKNIKFKLSNSEYNKYIRRSMRAYTDGELYGNKNIKKKYKKWVKAKIIIDGKELSSEIRLLGDWKDHLRPPITSLKVKILEGSFFGLTRFNLFLPETRKSENEVFWTLMLKTLNFPALFTKIVEINLNGNIYKAIFQEDATKEFLERSRFTETVILKKNDFGFYLNEDEKKIYDEVFSASFVIDNNNFLKNDISNFIASEAISLRSNIDFEKRVVNTDFFRYIHQKYAPHGLSDRNRKYIYLPYKKLFLPLYYDGDVQFLPGKTKCKAKIESRVLNDFKHDYLNLTGKNLSLMQECVFKDVYELSNKELKKDKFILDNDFNEEKDKDYLKIKNEILRFLEQNDIIKNENFFTSLKKGIFYTFIYNDKYLSCFLQIEKKKIKKCTKLNLSEYSKLISESGRYIKINNFKSYPINLGSFNKSKKIVEIKNFKKTYQLKKNATYIFSNKNIKDQALEFVFKNKDSKLIINGDFYNTQFLFNKEFTSQEGDISEIRYDKNLLTGCVNFFETNFSKVSILSNNMICEDSVNIKNSKGNISNININNSRYDAIDLDFSSILINNISIINAKNDCIDFSFGNYKIEKAFLKNCGDKGVSVGEKSTLEMSEANILSSNIGVASKDSSLTKIDKVEIKDINICLTAYNKKREFKGSELRVNEFDCANYKIKTENDKLSKIYILNEG